MMFKIVATAALALTVVGTNDSRAAEQQATAAPPDQARAEQLARGALAQQLKIGEDGVKVTKSTPRTWNDSSMGCGTPGNAALTVITEGYAVVLNAGDKVYQVHVSGDNAVVCNSKGAELRRDPNAVANARGLDVMTQKAREDLAQRLGADQAKIRIAGVQPKSFPDSGLECPVEGEVVQPGPVAGFVVSLQYAGRIYSYNTDRKTVRPCPRIEAQ